jgi:hypothetical protein
MVMCRPVDWRFSSIHRYIKNQTVDINWACGDNFGLVGFGERFELPDV